MTGSAASPGSATRDAPDEWDVESQDNTIDPLTRAEAERIFGPGVSRPSRVTPARVVAAQVVLTLGSTLVWWLFSSRPGSAALSALAGGAICWVPSAIFAWRLRFGGLTSATSWMVGEVVKIGVTVVMFIVIARVFPDVRWVALLVTYVLALKTYWLALAFR